MSPNMSLISHWKVYLNEIIANYFMISTLLVFKQSINELKRATPPPPKQQQQQQTKTKKQANNEEIIK